MIRETSAPDSTVIIISSPGRGTGVRSELSIVQLRAISGVALGLIVEVWSEYRYGFVDNEHAASSIKSRAMYETAVSARKATWRNGSAFGFDCRRHQKVAGSSPAVVIFFSHYREDSFLRSPFFFLDV